MSETVKQKTRTALEAGLAVTVAWLAFQHFIASDQKNDEFIQTQLIDTLNKNTEASTKSASSLEKLADSVDGTNKSILAVSEEMDDISDTSREVVNRFDRMISHYWVQEEKENANK